MYFKVEAIDNVLRDRGQCTLPREPINSWLAGELLLVVVPVGRNIAYSDMLHYVHGRQGCTSIALK